VISLPKTSSDPRKDEFYRSLLEHTVTDLLETVGEDDIEAVLLIGAPARGEVTVVDTPAGLYSLSDIDLVCVCSPSSDRATLRLKLLPWRVRLNDGLRHSSKGIDVSVMTRTDLEALPALIATYEMLRSPAVLWGDEGTLSSLPAIRVEDIPPAESLLLLHNRIIEELLLRRHAADGDLETALKVLYGTTKLALDAVAAFLYVERRVPPGYEERVELFRQGVLAEKSRLGARLAEYLPDLPAWARLKTTGDLDGLAAHFGVRANAPELVDLAWRQWRRYVGYADTFWRELLGRAARTDAADLGLAAAAALYGGLESLPRSVVRTWKLARPGAAPDGLFSTRRLLSGAAFASPRQRAYLTAVVTYLGFGEGADADVIDGLVDRHAPFRLGPDWPSLAPEERRELLLARLALFHETLLLGRTAGKR